MEVTLWGTRGTFPVPGPDTLRYGGDTTCLSVMTDDHVLVIDTGTGVRSLGNAVAGDDREIHVMYTHVHADHVMGFPFFGPLWEQDRTVHVLDHRLGEIEWSATALFDGVHFPLTPPQLPCDLRRISKDPIEVMADCGITIRRTLLNHPGGAYGYRIENDSRAIVFIPDNELRPCAEQAVSFDEVAEFCRGVEVLIHDAQFTPLECEERCGWGHSSQDQACDLAVAAGAQALVMTHHDPNRTDTELDELGALARKRLDGTGVTAHIAADRMSFQI